MTGLNLLPVLFANASLGALALASATTTQPPLIINETASMAKGVYAHAGNTQHLKRGDVIAMAMNASAQAYLGDKLGYPKDTLLIKRVAGLAGDVVCRHGTVVTINATTVHAPRRDTKGNALPFYDGCWVLLPQEVFLLGDDPASFDSRYFGPVTRDQLMGTYKGVVSW